MIIYGELKNKDAFPNYQDIAAKMWFKERNGKKLEISVDMEIADCTLDLSLDKWLTDERWRYENYKAFVGKDFDREWLNSTVTKIREFNELQFITSHKKVLTIDKRAFYILVIERMKLAEGLISEDDRQTWMSVEEFEKQRQDILNLTYDEANEMSLEEIKTMKAIDERPADWDNEEEEKEREEFFQALENCCQGSSGIS